MRSVILEPTKLMLIGTRTTYQATGDADTLMDQLYFQLTLLRGAIVNRTNNVSKKCKYIGFCVCAIGPIYYGPP